MQNLRQFWKFASRVGEKRLRGEHPLARKTSQVNRFIRSFGQEVKAEALHPLNKFLGCNCFKFPVPALSLRPASAEYCLKRLPKCPPVRNASRV